jgi:hypothetical protein
MGRETEEGNVSLHNFEQLYGMIASRTKNYSDEKICGMVNVLLKIIEWSSPRYKLNFNNIVEHGLIGLLINQKGEIERFTWWPTRMSLRTYLKHPKSGWRPLQRGSLGKDWTLDDRKRVLTEETGRAKGLRTHLNSGYTRKRRKKDE